MSAVTVPRRFGIWILLPLAALLALSAPFFAERVHTNISPICAIVVDGDSRYLNQASDSLAYSAAEVVSDTLYHPISMFEFPAGSDPKTLLIQFPFVLKTCDLSVLGAGPQSPCTLSIDVQMSDGSWIPLPELPWSYRNGVPPVMHVPIIRAAQAARITFRGADRVVLNSVSCFIVVPRVIAWGYALLLTLVFPIAFGVCILLAVLGLGACWAHGDCDAGRCAIVGMLLLAIFSVGWILFRSWSGALVIHFVLCALATYRGARVLLQSPSISDSGITRGIAIWSLLGTMLLVTVTIADTHGLGQHRVQPLDFLSAYMGAQRLSRGLPMPVEMADRPWLVHALYAPFDALFGRLSYWMYIGFISGLNALIVVPATLLLSRLNSDTNRTDGGSIVLLPVFVCYHFLGQRPGAAAFALLAAFGFLFPVRGARWYPALAMTLAIGLHPGTLFLLPSVFILGTLSNQGWKRLLTPLQMVAIPIVAYAIWSLFMHRLYPDRRNMLFLYPFMLSWLQPLDPSVSAWQAVRSLPGEHWRDLAMHRAYHLRHFFWTDNLSGTIAATFRWISLPNVLGYLAIPLLCSLELWRRHMSFVLMVIALPLLFHHLHIGDSHPQFHISATPFFGIAILLLASRAQAREHPWRRWLWRGLFVEWCFRSAFPLLIAAGAVPDRADPLRVLAILGGDQYFYSTLCVLPLLLWISAAFRLRILTANESGGRKANDDAAQHS